MEDNRSLIVENIADAVENDETVLSLAKDFLAMQHVYSAGIKEIQTKLEILDEEFHVKYDYNPIHSIESRLKSPKSLYNKMKKKNLPLTVEAIKENIYDVAGIRVIVNYIDDIDKIARLLVKQSDVTLISVKDYVKNPKPNGYRSLHIVVKIPIFLATKVEYIPVEVQIRTIAMDFWASLEHRLRYKGDGEVNSYIVDRLSACAEEINIIDVEMQNIKKEIIDEREEEDEFDTFSKKKPFYTD